MPDATHHHRNIQAGGPRASVFGASDGLVTNVSLILGVAGAHPSAGIVRLAGLAGLVAGAFSMASGEYVSMRAQRELLQSELEKERRELRLHPESERRELARIYEDRGISPALALRIAEALMSDDTNALEAHAREELGINPAQLGSPWQAAVYSFVSFVVGAMVPLVPWLVSSGTAAVLASIAAGTVAALAVGAALAMFTGRSPVFSALRQLVIAAGAGALTYLVGAAIGTNALR